MEIIFFNYQIKLAQESVDFNKKTLRNKKRMTLIHILMVLYFVIMFLFFNLNMFLSISQTVIWSINLILDYFIIKKSKISLNNSYTEYYETLKKYDNETYVKVIREKKLKRVIDKNYE
jgi:L-asparagine transporter-like permease